MNDTMNRDELQTFLCSKIKIERHRFSVTQGEVSISYDGIPLGRYGDNMELIGKRNPGGAEVIDGWAGLPDVYWNGVAARAIVKALQQAEILE